MKNKDYLYHIWMVNKLGYGNRAAGILLDAVGDAKKIYDMNEQELIDLELLYMDEVKALCKKDLTSAKDIIDECNENDIKIMSITDEIYPDDLRHIYAPPAVLYYKGNLPDFNSKLCISVVGTRNFTNQGEEDAINFSYKLARQGVVIISGLAKGIDSRAHIGALKADGITLGIAGCGLDVDYPRGSAEMKECILKRGAVISEYAPGMPPNGENFPVRNRIISGISKGTLVIQSRKSGGSLITASLALEQGKDVFAIPGYINAPEYEGCNELIKNYAKLTSCVDDILSEYQSVYGDMIDDRDIARAESIYKSNAQELNDTNDDFYVEIVDYSVKNDIDVDSLLENSRYKKHIFNVKDKNNIKKDKNNKKESRPAVKPSVDVSALTDMQREILAVLSSGKMHIDEISNELSYPSAKILAALTTLEIYKYIKSYPGKYYELY